MDFFNDYIRNICCYVVLTTVIFNLFPNERYVRYVRVFAGFILILIIIFPITNALGNNFDFSDLAGNFEIGMDEEELEDNINGYEKLIEERIHEMETKEKE